MDSRYITVQNNMVSDTAQKKQRQNGQWDDSIIKMPLTSIEIPIVEIRQSYDGLHHHSGISYTGKMASLY